MMSVWFFSVNGDQQGPFSVEEAKLKARQIPQGYAWRDGFAEWLPIAQIDELNSSSSS